MWLLTLLLQEIVLDFEESPCLMLNVKAFEFALSFQL
jgi:hypothetical protein